MAVAREQMAPSVGADAGAVLWLGPESSAVESLMVATVAIGQPDPAASRRNHVQSPGARAFGTRPFRYGLRPGAGSVAPSLMSAPGQEQFAFIFSYLYGRHDSGLAQQNPKLLEWSGARKRTRISDLRCVKAAL